MRYNLHVAQGIHNRLRDVRQMVGNLTQKELAARVGVTRQTIIAIESGRFNPSVRLALKLARALLVRVEDIFELTEDEDG